MNRFVPIFLASIVVAALSQSAEAVKVADITSISGQRTYVLAGWGLVVGLKGTGDGGDFQPAIRPLAAMLSKLADPSTVRDLANAQNVALVTVSVTLPATGVRNGDHIDTYVTSVGAAASLRGGRLVFTPLQVPLPNGGIFAHADGQVILEDPTSPLTGIIKGGAVMDADLPAKTINEKGQLMLILKSPAASWTAASTIAKIINDAEGSNGETIAVALDPKNVRVTIPTLELERPDSFISRVQRLPVPMFSSEARVEINETTDTLIVSGDVEISPVVISHRGLTISTINPAPVASIRTPVITDKTAVALDTAKTGGAKLQDVVDALDQLKVPAAERIVIVKELYRTGHLHAKLLVNGGEQ